MKKDIKTEFWMNTGEIPTNTRRGHFRNAEGSKLFTFVFLVPSCEVERSISEFWMKLRLES